MEDDYKPELCRTPEEITDVMSYFSERVERGDEVALAVRDTIVWLLGESDQNPKMFR